MVRPSINRFLWMIVLLVGFSALIRAQTKPPGSSVPDEIAFLALFHVVYDAPKPHWDRETCVEWLRERGLTGFQALLVITAANRYMRTHKEVEEELAHFHRHTQNLISPSTNAQRALFEARRNQEMSETVAELKFRLRQDDGEGEESLRNLLEDVKRNVRMREAQ